MLSHSPLNRFLAMADSEGDAADMAGKVITNHQGMAT